MDVASEIHYPYTPHMEEVRYLYHLTMLWYLLTEKTCGIAGLLRHFLVPLGK